MQDSKYKILFLPRWYPSRVDPLFGVFVKRHAEAVSSFCDVRVLYISQDKENKKLIEWEEVIWDNIPHLIFYYKKHITYTYLDKIIRVLLYFYCLQKGYSRLKKKNFIPDLLHVHVLLKTGLFAWWKNKTERKRYVITEHWSGYLPENGNFKGFIRKLVTRIVCNSSSGVTTVSEALKSAMGKHGLKSKYTVIRNVVDTELFSPTSEVSSAFKKKILHVSEFNEEAKNISGIIRSIDKLKNQRQDFILKIIGYGRYEKQLKELSDSLGLTGTFIIFQGQTTGKELAREFSNSSFFVLFSHYENNPCVLAEAMSSGLPVLATRTGGIPEMISKDTGILVPPRDEVSLVNAMDYMLSNFQNYNKIKLREFALESYSYAAIANKFSNLYDQAFKA